MDDQTTRDEIAALRQEVNRLNSHRFITVHNSIPRLILFQLYRGIAFGLGGVLGATVFLSITVWSLSQIDFIPIIGDWAKELIAVIEPKVDVDGEVRAAPDQP